MHVVFCIAPFSGHVNPALAVVAELAQRGHRVSFATTGEFAGSVRAAGGHPVVYRAAQVRHDGATTPDFAAGLSSQLLELRVLLPVLIPAFAADPPDVVVCDPMCWAARALAGRYRVPSINSITTMLGQARWSLGPVSAGFDPADPALPRLLAAASAVLTRYQTGLTALHLLGADRGIPAIAFHPRAFEARGEEFGADIHFVGPCLASRPTGPRGRPGGGQSWRPPAGGPIVLISLGTVFNRHPELFRLCIDALSELSCHVVAALGGMEPSALGPLPPHAEAHAYVPLPEVLRYADVFVGHAGMTSIMEALSFGVPIAAMPQISEQCLNAARLAELGLGLSLEPARLTGDGLRRAVTTLTGNAGIRSRLAWMRAEIERAPGTAGAAEAIENAVLAGHRDHPDLVEQASGTDRG